jgi:phosphate transport system substrate-binding protein
MNEDFLHCLRAQPSPEFLARLKSRLDRQPLHPRVGLVRAVLAAMLAGASAWALASFALRGEFAGLHWTWDAVLSGRSSTRAAGTSTAGTREQVARNGWLRDPWVPAAGHTPPVRSQKRGSGSGTGPVVPIPGSVTAASTATAAQYNSAAGLPPSGGGERLRIAVTLHADAYPNTIVKNFIRAGFNAPEVSVESADAILGHLCADNSLDFASVTRRMTPTEAATCNRWGMPPVEVKYAHQAVALVRSKLYGAFPLSARDIYLALAKTVPDPANPAVTIRNPYTSWNEVNPALPSDPILVLGPAATSERGQAFVSLLIEAGCSKSPPPIARRSVAAYESLCRTLRSDGIYADLPQTLLDQKLQMQPTVLAVIPYSTLQLRGGSLAASPIDGVVPSQQSIQDGSYPGSRTMYLYVNQNQARRLSSMRSFLVLFLRPLDNDYREDLTMGLGRAERAAILDNTFNALGYPPPAPGEPR